MCGRYTIYLKDKLDSRFKITKGISPSELKPNYNAAPGQFLPVVVKANDGNHMEAMKWGIVPRWATDIKIGYKLINARSESIFEKPMWKSLVTRQRALIPANGFYEWKKVDDKNKTPYFIHPKDQEIYSFAGLWESWRDVEGHELKTFTIITTAANKDMQEIHDRMPVMLLPDEEEKWLDPARDNRAGIEELLHPYQTGGLEIFEVTEDVNTPQHNAAYLITPVG